MSSCELRLGRVLHSDASPTWDFIEMGGREGGRENVGVLQK